jgi:ankyrin repeat protein
MKNIKEYREHLEGALLEQTDPTKDLNSMLTGEVDSSRSPSIERMKRLINAGADMDALDGMGYNALNYALENDHMDAIRFLIEAGARLEVENAWGQTPLCHAYELGIPGLSDSHKKKEAARLLIEAGADILAAFETLNDLEDFFGGDISWIPKDRLPPGWGKRHRARGAFGRF